MGITLRGINRKCMGYPDLDEPMKWTKRGYGTIFVKGEWVARDRSGIGRAAQYPTRLPAQGGLERHSLVDFHLFIKFSFFQLGLNGYRQS